MRLLPTARSTFIPAVFSSSAMDTEAIPRTLSLPSPVTDLARLKVPSMPLRGEYFFLPSGVSKHFRLCASRRSFSVYLILYF